MEISKNFTLSQIEEIKILSNIRVINLHDLNPVFSNDNVKVQFELQGEIKGAVTCYLCLDHHELSVSDKNFLFPMFVEAMNILLGKLISSDSVLASFNIRLSPPRISMIATPITTSDKNQIQKYQLELESTNFDVLVEHSLEVLN